MPSRKKDFKEINMSLYVEDDQLIVSITDLDAENPKDNLKNIFNTLYTTKASTQLRALGLTNDQLAAKDMATTIEVISNKDEITFFFKLKLLHTKNA